jgi:phosphoglycolate phosphatase
MSFRYFFNSMADTKHSTDRFQLLIFDWDGTIADSLHQIVNAIRFAINELGFPERDEELIRSIIGLGLNEAFERLFPGIDAVQCKSMASHYREFYLSTTSDGIRLFPDVAETIKLLYDNGHDLAVATGKSRRGLDRALRESGMFEYFHYTRCADETFSKPHPQMLEEIMEIFASGPEQALMIGDSEHDLQMAVNAGVASAAVTYGAQNSKYLLKFKPVACFNNLRELPQWLLQDAD